ncbi:helicase-exonuclease AddAB subunit AddB [Camelliibacillus cellulosilyticus]|uniref:ATP-dependent helicase/deoxyribonuclease subunit B n=1 Tax=Camelliibacillus cellulosilyticus TaxID=2174486 RepID=A0ABV9GPV8_9BACL
MTFRLMIGRAGTGKTHQCLQEIKTNLMEAPDGPPLLYIVPDQMTFHSEYRFMTMPTIAGTTRLDVYSFSRLAFRVLEHTGGLTRMHLSPVGIAMLLRKIVDRLKPKLRVFQKASERRGFYSLLQETISEFKRYSLTADDLHAQWQTLKDEDEALLKDKLHDLDLVYHDLELELLEKYVDSDDYLHLAADHLPKWEALKDAEVWVDGFESFTPQELGVLAALMKQAKRVTVTLTLDQIYRDHVPHDLTLFRRTAETCRKLFATADELSIDIEAPELFRETKRFHAASLAHIESHFEKRPFVKRQADDAVQIIEAVNRREEVEQTAREIIKLVRDEGYRYRDIAVLTRDLTAYRDLAATIFRDYGVPAFLDQKRTMHHHPLIELIRSALDTILQNWRYETVFRAIKTDLLYSPGAEVHKKRAEMDALENYVLAFGIHGDQWKKDEPWIYREYRGLDETDLPQTKQEREHQKILNQARWVVSPLITFENNMKKAKTVEAQATELFRFLEDLEVPEKIEQLRRRAEEEGRLDEAREHDQVWKAVIDCLDELVEAAGPETVSLERFAGIIDTGLDELRFALVPPALDQVLVGSIDRTRTSDVRAAFVLGVNEGVLPAIPSEGGILSDGDREVLADHAVELSPTARDELLGEEYLIYRALTTPSERLFLLYSIATEDGKSLQPSNVIRRMENYLDGLAPRFISGEPHETAEVEQLDFVLPSQRTIGHVAAQIRRWQRGYPISDLWWDVYNWLVMSPAWKDGAIRVLSSHFYQNQERQLTADTAEGLYGHDIRASVSRMETYNSCPFAHFASYGLRLKDREVYRLEAPDIGQLFHTALKLMTDTLTSEHRDWSELSQTECERLAVEVVERLAPRLQRQILLSSARFHYLKRKLRETVARAAFVLSRHAKLSGFSPIGLELPFGPGEPLPPLTFPLPNGGSMQIVGRIDRVDKGETSHGLLLRIIDYKSGDKDLNIAEVYYGIAMQMLAYLDVVITYAKDWLGTHADPAGVLYFHVHNPMLNEKVKPGDEDIDEKLFKAFKMKGLLLDDEEAIQLMDNSLSASSNSAIVPIGVKKDGSLKKHSSVADDETFNLLREYIRRTMQRVGAEIVQGNIDIAPYKLKDRTPCRFCAFRSFCQFDPSQHGNDYRVLKKEADDMIYQKMKDLLGEEEGRHE